jgi:ribose 5-phosphate isomerase A
MHSMDKRAILEAKRSAGYRAADRVRDGMVLGLGTGSTVLFTLERLGQRVTEGLDIIGVPTSYQTAMYARKFGIPLTTLDDHIALDMDIDGADQVDGKRRLIKGGGAAQTREKCVAEASREIVIVVDSTKLVDRLTAQIPVEVLPFASPWVQQRLRELGGVPAIREGQRKDGPVITDNGNFIVDCEFGEIADPEELEVRINAMTGVLTCGLFTGFTKRTDVIVGEIV